MHPMYKNRENQTRRGGGPPPDGGPVVSAPFLILAGCEASFRQPISFSFDLLILCSGESPLPAVPKGHIGGSFGTRPRWAVPLQHHVLLTRLRALWLVSGMNDPRRSLATPGVSPVT